MHRAGFLLLALLVSPPAVAGELPAVLERSTIDDLRAALRTQGLTLEDMAAVQRDRAPAALPLRSALIDGLLAAPLTAPDTANRLAAAIATDVGARGPAGNDGLFGVLGELWDVTGALPKGCQGPKGTTLSAQHIAAAEEQGQRWSKREVSDLQARLHPEVDRIVGELAAHAVAAACRVDAAFADVEPEARRLALEDASTLADAPSADASGRLASTWALVDRGALIATAQEWSEAVDAATLALSGLDDAAWPTSPVIWRIGLGEVWIGSPTANSGTGDPVLLVDPGGDDHWRLRPDAKQPAPTAVRGWIDLGGDDVWRSGSGGAGSAVFGVSAGVDLAGQDVHASGTHAAGSALFGVATWLDGGGDDVYESMADAQGFGLFGAALLRDVGRSNDVYDAERRAQGAAGPAGLGVLHDDGGEDRYLSSSDAQGAAWGARPHLAGGLGALVDDGGDDLYRAADTSQAAARWHALAILRDGGGDDSYVGGDDSIARAERQATAVLLDASGDDRYTGDHDALASSGSRAIAWLVDAAGRDHYAAHWGLGEAGDDGVAVLVDADRRGSWSGGVPPTPAGIPDVGLRTPRIAAVVGRTSPPNVLGLGGLGSSVSLSVADVKASLSGLGLPDEDGLDRAGSAIGALIRRRTAPGQLADLGRAIAQDATGRATDPEDYTTAWHLAWLGWIAKATPLAAAELATTAEALTDHPAWIVRAAAWDARAALGAIPDLELPEEDVTAHATGAAVALQREESAAVRAAAARAAGAFGEAGVASSLTDALLVSHAGLRRSAESALLSICTRTDGVAVARGLYAVASGETRVGPAIRDAALRILGATTQRDARGVLIEVSADADAATALAAAVGLARDGSREAAQALDAWAEAHPDAVDTLRRVVPPTAD